MTDDEVSFVNYTFHCNSKHFSYCDQHYKHIVTGGLRFISIKTKQLLKNTLLSPLSLFFKYSVNSFTSWYDTVISHLMVKFKFQQAKHILQDKEVLESLNNLHEKFAVVC